MKDLRKELALLRYSTGPTSLAHMKPVEITDEQAAELMEAWRQASPHIMTLASAQEPTVEILTPWFELTPDTVPTGEVLAANFNTASPHYCDKMYGRVRFAGTLPGMEGEFIARRSINEEVLPVTHYMDLKPYDL